MSSLQTIQRMMAEQFDLKLEDLTPDAQLENLLDSLSVIEPMFTLEDELNIKLANDRVEDFKTVGDVAAIIDKIIAEQTNTAP